MCTDPRLSPEPRFHFDYFYPAILTVFVLMTGEWVDAMDPGLQAVGPLGSLYYAGVVLVGRYLIINLLVATVLNAFSNDDDDDDAPNLDAELAAAVKAQPEGHSPSARRGSKVSARDNKASARPGSVHIKISDTQRAEVGTTRVFADAMRIELEDAEDRELQWPRDYSLLIFSIRGGLRRACITLVSMPAFDSLVTLAIIVSSIALALDSPRLPPDSSLATTLSMLDLWVWPWFFLTEMTLKAIAFGFACGPTAYLNSEWNRLDLVIIASSFVVFATNAFPVLGPLKNVRILRVLRPLRLVSRDPGMKLVLSSLFKALPEVTNVAGVIMSLQLVFAVLGMQLFMGALASCSDPTVLTQDACVSDTGRALAALATPIAQAGPGAAHQLLLAPLAANATAMLNASASVALGSSLTLAGSSVTLATSAALAASSMSSTGLVHAAGAAVRRVLKGSGGGHEFDASKDKREWVNSRVGSFDNFQGAMLLLYVMSTGDEWEIHMFRMMDSTEVGRGPERNDFAASSVFSIVWMFVGSFFAMNLFVGVIVEKFNQIKAESDGSATMTQEQLQWVSTMKAMTNSAPARQMAAPKGVMQRRVYEFVTSQIFDGFIMAVIAANISVMACDYWGIEENADDYALYNRMMFYFSLVYYAEATLKLTGLGCGGYFADSWCRFDFTLVAISLLDQFASELLVTILPVPPMLLRVLRVVRILRILRLLKQFKELRNLIVTMIYSFPSLVNVGSLLALIVFMYAVLGVDLFTFLMPQDNINKDRNFNDLGHAALLLFQCLTNDAWSGLMADAMETAEQGHCSDELGNCGTWFAVPYFISFQILGSFVFLNLVVAVILENFTSMSSRNPDLISAADLDRFKEGWAKFDGNADYYIDARDLPKLMLELPQPLGLHNSPEVISGNEKAQLRLANSLCMHLQVPEYDGDIAYLDVLEALIQYNFRKNEIAIGSESFRKKASKLVPPPPAVPSKPAYLLARQETYKLTMSKEEAFANELPLHKRYSLEVIKEYTRERINRRRAADYVEKYAPATSAPQAAARTPPCKQAPQTEPTKAAATASKAVSQAGGAPRPAGQKRPACGKAKSGAAGAKAGGGAAKGGASPPKNTAALTKSGAAVAKGGTTAGKSGAAAAKVGSVAKGPAQKLAESAAATAAATAAAAADAARKLSHRASGRSPSPAKSDRKKGLEMQSTTIADGEELRAEPILQEPPPPTNPPPPPPEAAPMVDPPAPPVEAASAPAAEEDALSTPFAGPLAASAPVEAGGAAAGRGGRGRGDGRGGRGGRGADGGRGGRGSGRGRGASATPAKPRPSAPMGSADGVAPQAQSGAPASAPAPEPPQSAAFAASPPAIAPPPAAAPASSPPAAGTSPVGGEAANAKKLGGKKASSNRTPPGGKEAAKDVRSKIMKRGF